MKHVWIAIVLLLSIGTLSAQERGQRGGFNTNPEERVKAQVEHLEKELKLNAEQKDSIYKWSLEQAKEQQALFQDRSGDREQIREKMTALREKTNVKILSVLDEGQKAKYAEIQKEAAERMQRGNRGGQGRGNRGTRN